MDPYRLLLIAAIVVNGVLIVILSRRYNRSLTTVSFILFIIMINTWAVPDLLINISGTNLRFFETLDKIAAFGYTFIPVAFLVFALSFTNQSRYLRSYLVSGTIAVSALVMLYLAWGTDLIEFHGAASAIMTPWGYSSPPAAFFGLFLVWFEGLMIISVVLLVQLYRTTLDQTRRRQSLWVLVALFFPLVVGSITDGILPMFQIAVFPAAVPLTSVMALIVSYAIFKHELFDLSPLAIISNMAEGVVSVDTNARIVLVNETAQKLLGIKAENLVGEPIYKALPLKDSRGRRISVSKRPITKTLRTGRVLQSSDYFLTTRTDPRLPVSYTISPAFSNHRLVGATFTIRDISVEKEMAENKDNFIRVASHELKAPVTSLRLFTQMLVRSLNSRNIAEARRFSQKIDEQVERVAGLIDDLLDLSRLQTGKIKIEKSRFDLDQLITESVEMIRQTSKKHKIKIVGRINRLVDADRQRIYQVLLNLLSNAVKYSPSGGEIVVHRSVVRDKAQVSISDKGVGISDLDKNRIFDRLYQARTSIGGLGIGLYVCSEIIKQHSGQIWVESQPGRGSTFFFSLPLVF